MKVLKMDLFTRQGKIGRQAEKYLSINKDRLTIYIIHFDHPHPPTYSLSFFPPKNIDAIAPPGGNAPSPFFPAIFFEFEFLSRF